MGRDVPVIRALLWAILAGGGCAPHVPAALQTWPGVSAEDIVAMDAETLQLVAVRSRRVQTLPDGRLQVELELANLSALPVDVQAQTIFRDGAGTVMGEPTPNEIIVLPGSGSWTYAVISPMVGPVRFTIQLQIP